MKRVLLLCACLVFLLSSCDGWPFFSPSYSPSPILASRTPSIETATPFITTATVLTLTASPAEVTLSPSPSPTLPEATPSGAAVPTLTPVSATVDVKLLGCNTSIDIVHGMGEVTNAYVTISNLSDGDIPNLCATLRALDEGRPHPDKTKCVPSLPHGFRVSFKLTVDSTYRENSPVQVDVTSSGALLERVGEPACTAIGLFSPDVDELGVPRPIP